MAAQKTPFDWVKVLGIAAAVFLLIGSQMYSSRRASERREALEREQAERARAERERLEREPKKTVAEPAEAVKTSAPVLRPAGEKDNPPAPPKAKPAEEIPEAAPVRVAGERLELLFSAKGAALKQGKLADYYVEATSSELGVELLDEIDPGRLSLGLAEFKFGGQEYAGLESRVWSLAEDSQGFAGPERTWTVAYATTLREPKDGTAVAKITKRFRIRKDGQGVDLDLSVENLTGQPAAFEYGLRGPAGVLLEGPPQNPRQGAFATIKCALAARKTAEDAPTVTPLGPADALSSRDKRRVSSEENLWAVVSNGFFASALLARDPRDTIEIVAEPIRKDQREDRLKANDQRFHADNICPVFFRRPSSPLPPGEVSAPDRYALYLGPYQEPQLAAFEESLQPPLSRPAFLNSSVQYCDVFGWHWPNIDRLGRLLLALFNGIHAVTHSYGMAVILLTLVVKLCLHPIQRRQTVSMHKMQLLQPRLKAIEEKYAGQTSSEMKQKKEMEKWDLMRKSGANPLTGCLPMFFQMPIFFALYGTFSHAFEIRQAPFLWVRDLSLPDHLAALGFWPHELNLLPILYIGMTIVQTLLQPKPATSDPQQDMNRKMMMFMPVFFGFIIYGMPSGLVLYFAASATFGILESWYIKKFVLKNPPPGAAGPEPPKAASKFAPASPIPGIKAATK